MTTLRGCLDAAKESILGGATDRAIDLCFHILNSYPKCIEAHCLLGEAYREKGLAAQSESTLIRVLSADPENLVARWALSILEEDKGDIDSAAVELRRAFELSPGHAELRRELGRLTQSDVFLTRGALGRIYARGEMFDRAIAEFREVLAEETGRLDIQVALAEALWRDRQLGEARSACQRILADSPDCLKANIILGHILHVRGEHDNARKFLSRAAMLEPENVLAEQLLEGTDIELQLERREVELPEFEAIDEAWESGLGALTSSADTESAFDDETPSYSSLLEDLDFLRAEPGLPSGISFEPHIEHPEDQIVEQSIERSMASIISDIQDISSWQPFDPPVNPSVEPTLASSVETSAMPDFSLADEDDLDLDDELDDELDAVERTASPGIPSLDEDIEDDLEESLPAAELESFDVELDELSEDSRDNDSRDNDSRDNDSRDNDSRDIDLEDDDSEEINRHEVRLPSGSSLLAGLAAFDARGVSQAETTKSADDYVQSCLQKVQAHPDDFQAHLDLALAYHRLSNDDLAVAEFELVLKSSPELVDRVVEGLKALLSSNPNHMLAHRRLGDAYMKVGRFQEAIDCYNRCLTKQRTGSSPGTK